ncbi:hypothetical protein [Blastococcus sp. SYSU D00695]
MPPSARQAQAARSRRDARWARVRPVLDVGTLVWVVAWGATLYVALTTSWPPSGEAPTAEQVRVALTKVEVSGVVGISLPVLGLALAVWCRREVAALLLFWAALAALLGTRLLYGAVT